jgi:hypothetical protein
MTNLTISYSLLLALLSLLPSDFASGGGLKNEDAWGFSWDGWISSSVQNAAHVPAYAILILLALAGVTKRCPGRLRTLILAIAVCMAYGVLLEALQGFVPGRTASVSDGLSNVVGVALGAALWHALPALRRPRVTTHVVQAPPPNLPRQEIT